MTHIDFFKLQAKKLLQDWQNREQKHFAFNFRELFRIYDVKADEEPTLMKAQHLLALSLGRDKWSDLLHESEEQLVYTRWAFEQNAQEEKEINEMLINAIQNDEVKDDDLYHGLVRCEHCGRIFPIDKPNHLPSCDGEDWDVVPIEENV